ncbi:hypothetical protein THRCLA_08507 [Thraustotheca clavata]|uniref:PH domain-containing protein n=1 Tax=Thraustotheca clavata TaxID=74557 RepID=A0A1V9Z5S8_9STRA|nr:hypothetical protein THRCLA_08507 [Thraustotheca clavata]
MQRHASAPMLSKRIHENIKNELEKMDESRKQERVNINEKSGYLTKHNTGKWKRRRWHERWFVLEKGVLSYYKYANANAEAHGSLLLQGTSALLTIQGDVPRGTPTPFCFNITVGTKTLMLCANTDEEFQEWTNAISSTINRELPMPLRPTMGMKKNIVMNEQGSGGFDIIGQSIGLGALGIVNPIIVIIRYGNTYMIWMIVVLMNILCLYFYQKEANKSDASVSQKSACALKKMNQHVPEPKAPILGNVDGTKAIAGCSLRQLHSNEENASNCWEYLDATRFNVRQGPNYRKTKQKGPSSPALLPIIATDIYRSDSKIDNVGSIVQLPMLPNESKRDLLIINCQVPCYAPSNPLWGEKQGDGDGFNFITYYCIPESIRNQLDAPSPPTDPAIRLLKAFLENDNSSIRDRLKAIGIVVNPSEQNLGRTERHLLETYNGQPILTRPQHRFYRGDGYFEVDIDAHLFNFVARRGLCGVTDHFSHMIVDFGFVLEGQEDDELPEQILGSRSMAVGLDVTGHVEAGGKAVRYYIEMRCDHVHFGFNGRFSHLRALHQRLANAMKHVDKDGALPPFPSKHILENMLKQSNVTRRQMELFDYYTLLCTNDWAVEFLSRQHSIHAGDPIEDDCVQFTPPLAIDSKRRQRRSQANSRHSKHSKRLQY